MDRVIVICGPTASGKTGLGIKLANVINGEIISADSMQIYKDMDIGTAKPTKEEQAQAKHHLIDFVSPDKRYTVSDFKEDATKKIKEIIAEGKTPIIVGGTGLYINSLIYNIEYKDEECDLEYRKSLENLSIEELYEEALKIDKEATLKVASTDRKRLSRILEIYHTTGKTKTEQELDSRKPAEFDYKVFVLNWDREKLYERINLRVDLMIKDGLVEEVKKLVEKYKEFPTAMQGLGYKEVVEYLNGDISEEEMIDKIKQESRHYAKRQVTWFKKYEGEDIATWLNGENSDNLQVILEELGETETKEKK